jgi:hypothetical protein
MALNERRHNLPTFEATGKTSPERQASKEFSEAEEGQLSELKQEEETRDESIPVQGAEVSAAEESPKVQPSPNPANAAAKERDLRGTSKKNASKGSLEQVLLARTFEPYCPSSMKKTYFFWPMKSVSFLKIENTWLPDMHFKH